MGSPSITSQPHHPGKPFKLSAGLHKPMLRKLMSRLLMQKTSCAQAKLFGLEIICGQKLKNSSAKKAIAGFKIREGRPHETDDATCTQCCPFF